MNTMWASIWKLVTRITIIVGALLALFAVGEVVRLFLLLYRIAPLGGYLFLALLGVGAVLATISLVRQITKYPRPLIPPPLPSLEVASHKEMKRYAQYLITYQTRLSDNAFLSEPVRDQLREEVESMSGLLNHHPLNEDLVHIIRKSDAETLPVAHTELNNRAEREIRRSVRDVMLGVTLSPYHSIDILIVLYRNFSMIFRIMRIYATSPAPRAQWRIVRDVIRVIATVNFLYVGRNLIENLFAFVPFVGRVADDIGQGLGAGLFTSACGHAVIDRCASYHGWEKEAAVESLAAQSKDFIRDVKNIFTKDVLPDIKNRIISEAPQEKTAEPGFWDNLQKGINSAFDATIKTVGTIMPAPMWRAEDTNDYPDDTNEMAGASLTPRPAPSRPDPGTTADLDTDHRRHGHSGNRRSRPRKGVARVLHTFGQRVKYTLGIGQR